MRSHVVINTSPLDYFVSLRSARFIAKSCPTGWTAKGHGGYIAHLRENCPYDIGSEYDGTGGWYWCHP